MNLHEIRGPGPRIGARIQINDNFFPDFDLPNHRGTIIEERIAGYWLVELDEPEPRRWGQGLLSIVHKDFTIIG